MIAFFASDLLWRTRIRAACDDLGIASLALPADSLPDLEGAVIALDDPAPALAQIAALRESHPHARIVAFGPHVDQGTLERAKALGAALVLPRGAFANRIEHHLRWADGASADNINVL